MQSKTTHRHHRLDSRSGFTLVEVLLVVAILGILSAIVVAQFGNRGKDSREKGTRASIAAVGTAISIFQIDMGRNPKSLDELAIDPGSSSWKGPYVNGGVAALKDAWGTPLSFKPVGNSFKIVSAGEDLATGTADDITSF